MSNICQEVMSQVNKAKSNSDITGKIIDFKESQTIKKSPAGYDMVTRDYLIEFGNKLKELRTDKLGCTQDKLGDIMNLSQSEVSRLEHGQRKINIIHLFTLKRLNPNLDLNNLVDICNTLELQIPNNTRKEDL
ncbi:MAG: helix-turn-helix transcriptional regulator [Lachnospiraceae bacterium]|nr:helix-turn-helix transcriptional regulator [Lachnospiraceae bacterium]